MSIVLLSIAVTTTVFSIFWLFAPKMPTRNWFLFSCVVVGLGGAAYSFTYNEDFNFALFRFVTSDIGYLLGYVIVKITIPSLQWKIARKMAAKQDTNSFF